ncbi:MAG: 6-phosphogluconolactonase, partial [Aquificaceae bacterium]
KVCLSTSDGLLRLSLTESYLNLSCVVLFFLKGEEKGRALQGMLSSENLPAGRIKGELRTYIFTDLSSE